MGSRAELRSLLAALLAIPVERLNEQTSLRSLEGSLGTTRLRLGLKRIGHRLPAAKIPTTFGQLETLLRNNDVPQAPVDVEAARPKSAPAAYSRARIGHDIQDLASLPDVSDYWQHEFYVGAFTPAELAYAVVSSDPKEHLAGFWTAKEALRKSDPALRDVAFTQITVAHNADGRPYFVFETPAGAIRLGHRLSISHAGNIASAVVLAPS